MAFFAKSFMFDQIPSETYNLGIVNFDTGRISSPLGSDVEIYSKQIYRKPKAYLYGTSQRPTLEFPITIGSQTNFSADVRGAISRWLFGQNSYKKLQIFQDDLESVYFNCFLTKPTAVYYGNLSYAIECTVVCDAPWAWEFPRTTNYTFSGNNNVDFNFTYYNSSENSDYMYPLNVISLNILGQSFQITNYTDTNRLTSFTDLSANEVLTVDNDRQVLSSNTGLLRMSNFNMRWFRLLPGANSLNIKSQIGSFSMVTQNVKKVGG